jgi:hypothetical protein
MALVTQPNAAPTRKIKAVIASGVVTSIVVAVGLVLGIDIPADQVDQAVGAAVVAVNLIGVLVGYFTKSRA